MPLGVNSNWDALLIQFLVIAMTLAVHTVAIAQLKRSTVSIAIMAPLFVLPANVITLVAITRGYTADIGTVLIAFFGIGAGSFMLISDLLLIGLGRWLNKKRKDTWIKEMEYVYLLLGCVGIAGLVNRLDSIENRIASFEWAAPTVLSVAVALRFVKTRAEVNKWNELTDGDI
jgi:hypothetical protein